MLSLAIESINSAADRWAAWMVAASLDAALLLALVGVLWLAIRRRVAPQVGCWLFLLVPFKLLLPLDVTIPTAAARWTPSALVSSRFPGTGTPEVVESRPSIEPRTAAVGVSRPAPLEPSPPARPGPVALHQTIPPSEMPTDSPADAAAGPVAEAPALSMPAGAMIAWLAVVVLLSGRLVLAQLRFRARLRHIPPLDEEMLAVNVGELCRHIGVAGTVPIAEDDAIAVPSVWGIARPTILLPRGIAGVLTAEQLQWVLLHELAHVRRRDMVVLLLQRLAAILHFFNPAIWIANRVVDQLREFACDDLASAAGHASAVESGEAFVRILQHATRGHRRLEGALGVFGLDAKATCLGRVRRLLDAERPLHPAPGRWSLCGLMLLAAVSVPHLRAAGEAKPTALQAPAGEAPAGSGRGFELRVVGPGGKPVPEAAVEFRTDPSVTAGEVRQGRFVRRGPYGTFVAADAEGRLALEFPRRPTGFELFIQVPGYGPYWASWSHGTDIRSIPPRFTAELEAAWSVGGVIVDAGGKPVEGVTIQPSIEFKKRPGLVQQMGSGAKARTDAAGRWHFDCVPASMAEVFVEINHPGSMPLRRALTRAEFGIERGREPTGKIVLERGLTVTGKVTDDADQPIAGALVRTKFLNDIREARTGPDGVYHLAGCEPRSTRIVVSAKGRATDMKELNIEPGMGPVDFAMKPGGTVRIRVLDERGNPVPRTRIFFQRWRGMFKYFEFDHVNQDTDDKGVWVWHEAPLDEFKADICPPGRMQLVERSFIAREEEYVFRLAPDVVVTGKVVDAETKRPIKSFRVVPGIRGSVDHMNWARGESFIATDGHYEFRPDRGYLAHLVRIEADGYLATASREIKSDEGNVVVDFELKKATNIAAKVVTPRNLPAAGARIALGVAGSQINVKNGDIDDSSTYSAAPRPTGPASSASRRRARTSSS